MSEDKNASSVSDAGGHLSPETASPFPAGNLSEDGDDSIDWGKFRSVNLYFDEISRIGALRSRVAFVIVVVLAVLLLYLGFVIYSHTGHIDRAQPTFRLKEEVTDILNAAPPSAGAQSTGAASGALPFEAASSAKKEVGDGGAKLVPVVAVDLSAIGNSVAAIITVLVVSVTVLSIALLRSTFNLAPMREGGVRAEAPKNDKERDVTLPGIELAKAIAEALSTAFKGIAEAAKK